jgi:hypothetical protein
MTEQDKHTPRGIVLQQVSVRFADADITAVLATDNAIYAALPHLCRALNLDAESQRERIEEQTTLARGLIQFPLAQGKQLTTIWCLRADLIPYWLAIVPTKRMKAEKKARIDFYQAQVADVLGRLFGSSPVTSPSTEVSLGEQHPAYTEGLAIARMALDTAQLASAQADKIDKEVEALKEIYEMRITALEARLMPRETINEGQAERISDLVKQVALALSRKVGGNTFGVVYGQLYRTFNITSYKLLTQAQYPKAIEWLEKQLKSYEQ